MLELKGIGKTNIDFTLEDKVVVIIGRGDGCDLRLDSPKLSRKHCMIKIEKGRVTIEDLASKNGTRINGKKIRDKIRFNVGDELSFSDAFTFVLRGPQVDDAATPVDPAFAPGQGAVQDGDSMAESLEVLPAKAEAHLPALATPAATKSNEELEAEASKKRIILISSVLGGVLFLFVIALIIKGGDENDAGDIQPKAVDESVTAKLNYMETLDYVVDALEKNDVNPDELSKVLDQAIKKEENNGAAFVLKDLVKLLKDADGDYEVYDWEEAKKFTNELIEIGAKTPKVDRWARNHIKFLRKESEQMNFVFKMNDHLQKSNWVSAIKEYEELPESSRFRTIYKDKYDGARLKAYTSSYDLGQKHMKKERWDAASKQFKVAQQYSTPVQAESIQRMIIKADSLEDQKKLSEQADDYFVEKRYDAVLRTAQKIPEDSIYYDRVHDLVKKSHKALGLGDAIALYDGGKAEDAIKKLSTISGQQSLVSKISHVTDSLKKAEVALKKEKIEDAVNHWKVVIDVEKNQSNFYYLQAQSKIKQWDNKDKLGATYKRLGDNAYADKNYEKAREYYNKARQYMPDEVDAIYAEMKKMASRYYNIGLNFRRLNKENALKHFKLAKSLSSPTDSIYLESEKEINDLESSEKEE